jgi:hypothetical protein
MHSRKNKSPRNTSYRAVPRSGALFSSAVLGLPVDTAKYPGMAAYLWVVRDLSRTDASVVF